MYEGTKTMLSLFVCPIALLEKNKNPSFSRKLWLNAHNFYIRSTRKDNTPQ